MTGLQIAELMKPEATTISICTRDGYLENGTIYLSRRTYMLSNDTAKLSAAHECAHAIQHRSKSKSFAFWSFMRSLYWPTLCVLTAIACIVTGSYWKESLSACVIVALLRYFATIWVEADAWLIAMRWLRERKLLDDPEEARRIVKKLIGSYLHR